MRERRERQKGVAVAIIDLLSSHGSASESLKSIIMREKDLEVLRTWLKTAASAASIEEFEEKM